MENIGKKINIDRIIKLSDARGPSGFEQEVVKALEESSDLNLRVDDFNNVFLNESKNYEITVMLDAHLDEVGFMVQFIENSGAIKMIPLGGWTTENVVGSLMQVKGKDGWIRGIVGYPPPHFLTEEKRAKKIELNDLFLDVGTFSKEETLSLGIEVGAPIVPLVNADYNEKNGLLFGKAFDNRIGCACVLETLEVIKKISNIRINVIGALAAQEEVGTRGAQITANVVKPDIAIVFEGSPADDIFTEENRIQGGLKKGVQIRHLDRGYVSHAGIINIANKVAKMESILVQHAVRSGGSTNAAKIHVSNEGVPTLVLGIPTRYVHSCYGFCSIEDIRSAVRLAVGVIRYMNDKADY